MWLTDSLGQTEIIRHLYTFLLYANWNNNSFFSTSSILLHHDWPSCRPPIRHHWCANAGSQVSVYSSDFRKLRKYGKIRFCSFLSICLAWKSFTTLSKFTLNPFISRNQSLISWYCYWFKKPKAVAVSLYNTILRATWYLFPPKKILIFISLHVIRDNPL